MNIAYIKPKQRIPRSEKDADWGKKCVMFFKGACQPAIDRSEALRLYRAANGEMEEGDYLYVTNPFNTTRPELQGYPAKMKNYDIISPNINLLLGEKSRRTFTPIVYAVNTNFKSKQLEEETKLLIQEMQKMFVNEAITLGIPMEKEQVQQDLQGIADRIKNLPDELSELGQLALEYIIDYNDVIRYLRKGFYDYLCTALIYTYKDVYKDKTQYDIISPLHFAYLASPHIDFIEDGEACRATYFMTVNEVYDRFQDLTEEEGFTEEFKTFLEKYGTSQSSGVRDEFYYNYTDINAGRNELFRNVWGYLPEERYSHGVEVRHINWRSQTKLGLVTRPDIFGNVEKFEVSEDYKVTEGETVEWEWVDEIWEGYCIADMYYLGIKPIPIQRGEIGLPKKAKLLYNGRKYTSRHTVPTSIVKKGLAYQKGVNIVKYRAEESLAKNLDKVILFPLGLIPKKEGWDEDKLMYYVRAFSFLFFDDTRPNAVQMVSAMKDLNMSMTEHILRSYELVRAYKQEWDEVCGINPQRKAQISNSAGKGVTQIAQDTSAIMSEELFLTYEEFERREYTGLLELSKYAFSDGKQAHFIKLDGTKAFLNIHNPDSFVYSNFGVFIKNGARELAKLEMVRANVQNFVQNQMMPNAVLKAIESDNFAELHKIMDEVTAKLEERFQQEQQTQKDIQGSKERVAGKQEAFDYYDSNLKSYTDIQVALIESGMKIAQDLGKAEVSGDKEAINIQQDNLEKNALALMQNATKLKEIASRERIAKDNNETKLKNKVVGEK